jgi:hypothetical protein
MLGDPLQTICQSIRVLRAHRRYARRTMRSSVPCKSSMRAASLAIQVKADVTVPRLHLAVNWKEGSLARGAAQSLSLTLNIGTLERWNLRNFRRAILAPNLQ